MLNPVFPTFSAGAALDSGAFRVEFEDPAQRSDMEGGYVITRAKHTRRPRRTFSIVYRQLNTADKDLLDAFYDTVKGGSVIFDWVSPQSLLTLQVRMKGPMSEQYVGRGVTQRWDCSMTFEEA